MDKPDERRAGALRQRRRTDDPDRHDLRRLRLHGDTVRVFASGYAVGCYDSFFGHLFGLSSYTQRLGEFQACGFGDNVDIGDVTLTLPSRPSSAGSYSVVGPHFTLDVTATFVPGAGDPGP